MKTILEALQELKQTKTITDIDQGVLESMNDARNDALKHTSKSSGKFLTYFASAMIEEYPELLDYCDITVGENFEYIQAGMYIDEKSAYEQVLDLDIGYLC